MKLTAIRETVPIPPISSIVIELSVKEAETLLARLEIARGGPSSSHLLDCIMGELKRAGLTSRVW